MEYTKDDIRNLQSWRKIIDSDNIKIKEKIKEKLLNNKDIIHVLNNLELERVDAEPDDYFGINIRPYYLIPETQTHVKNFICYETSFNELDRYNKSVKYMEIVFYILCHKDDLIDQDTYLARHDLLGSLIVSEFNHSNYFGPKIRCISDKPSVTDNDYATRTIIFEQYVDNNLVKTNNGIPSMYNKDVRY